MNSYQEGRARLQEDSSLFVARRPIGGSVVDERSQLLGLPYDFAYITDWVWAEVQSSSPRYEQRASWYEQHVRNRPLWVPLDEASYWFLTHVPTQVDGQDARDVAGWVEGIRPVYATDPSEDALPKVL